MNPQRTAVVLVEFHSAGQVAERARVAEEEGYLVVIADNSGGYEGPGRVIATGGNVGFGAGCNRAISVLPRSIDVVVLMNPDVEIEPVQMSGMVEVVLHGEWDGIAPWTVSRTRTHAGFSLPSPWREPGVTIREAHRLGSESLAGGQETLLGGMDGRRADTGPRFSSDSSRFGSGALVVLARPAFDAVGGFDERYFLYVEDADLWERMARSGARLGFDRAARLVHEPVKSSV